MTNRGIADRQNDADGSGTTFGRGTTTPTTRPWRCTKLGEIHAQERKQRRVRVATKIGLGQLSHVGVVVPLAVRMDGIAAGMAAQIAVELRADVEQLVEQRHELVVERLIQKPRETERHQIQNVLAVDDEPLHLIVHAAMPPDERAAVKPQRRHSRLQAVARPLRAWVKPKRMRDGCTCGQVGQRPTMSIAKSANVSAEVKRFAAAESRKFVESSRCRACEQP